MGYMLKIDSRKYSAKAVEDFFNAYLYGCNEIVDVVISSSNGICVFYDVPCDVVYENYPNDEDSYSLNIHWSKASGTKGNKPKDLFPNYPQKSEYKSYFDYMHTSGEDFYFHNTWKDHLIIFIVKQINMKHNDTNIDNIIKELSQ